MTNKGDLCAEEMSAKPQESVWGGCEERAGRGCCFFEGMPKERTTELGHTSSVFYPHTSITEKLEVLFPIN